MAPKEGPRFDRRDLAILAALQRDGRITNQELASFVALAPSACLRRRRALEASGLIAGYRADIAIERVAPGIVVYAEVRMARHAPADFDRFERAVERQPAIVEAVQTGGDTDYLLKAVVEDLVAWRAVNDALVDAGVGSITVKTHVVLKWVKRFVGYPLAGAQDPPAHAAEFAVSARRDDD